MITKAEIRAKVIAVRPINFFDWELLVLIKDVHYTQKHRITNEITTGKVILDDFTQKAVFDVIVSNYDKTSILSRVKHLFYGDIINFSIVNEGSYYLIVSLYEEKNESCLVNYLDMFVAKYGKEDKL